MKGKLFDGSSSSDVGRFSPAYIPLAKASHTAKLAADGRGKCISSSSKGIASHMQ